MAQNVVSGFMKGNGEVILSQRNDYEPELASYMEIDDATRGWLNNLNYVWSRWKKSTCVTQLLVEYFASAPNPYLSCLRILVNIKDYQTAKPKVSLAITVVEEFANWISKYKDSYSECLVPELKVATFKLTSGIRNLTVVKTLCDVYQFVEHKELFVTSIEDMIEKHKYKEAAQLTMMLKLESFYSDPGRLLFPLIIQDKTPIVEEFLVNQPVIQRNVVKYLDDLLAPNKSFQQTLDDFIVSRNISDVKMSICDSRPLVKLIKRFAKMYKLTPEDHPNCQMKANQAALKFLLYKRYKECSLSLDSWREMAKEAIGDNSNLHLELVRLIMSYGHDNEEALYWARYLDVPRDRWPYDLRVSEEFSSSSSESKFEEESWEVPEDNEIYHSLNLQRDSVVVIDNPKDFKHFLDAGLENVSMVGIDLEWKPSFAGKPVDLALMQIATPTNAYILDVTLMGNQYETLWQELNMRLFQATDILKIGFSLSQDCKMMRQSVPALSNVKPGGKGYLDLLFMWKNLKFYPAFDFPCQGEESFKNESLSKLVELCLGKRLKKLDQFSNWERRPLRESQIIYAALDAYCLIEVYEAIKSQCNRIGISFAEVLHKSQHGQHSELKKTAKK